MVTKLLCLYGSGALFPLATNNKNNTNRYSWKNNTHVKIEY